MRFFVTGASGYIGERLVRRARQLGHDVTIASRRPVHGAESWKPFDLADTSRLVLPAGTDVVFHLAATTTSTDVDTATEVRAAQRLIEAATQAGARFIFMSSQTARADAPTSYGRTKWEIEQLVRGANGWSIRPGLVYGGSERGLFGTLAGVVRRIPVIPAFLPAPRVQPVHVDDLVAALIRCAETHDQPRACNIGAPASISFTRFLATLAIARVGRLRVPIPVPVVAIRIAGALMGRRLRVKSGLDRLTSLFELRDMKTAADLEALGVALRPLSSGLSKRGDDRRRQLVREGRTLSTYVLKGTPPPGLVRRYVRFSERLKGGQPLPLPSFVHSAPVMMALLDVPGNPSVLCSAELRCRLGAAVLLAEATPQGATRFLGSERGTGFLVGSLRLCLPVASEIAWRLLRAMAAPVVKVLLRGAERNHGR